MRGDYDCGGAIHVDYLVMVVLVFMVLHVVVGC